MYGVARNCLANRHRSARRVRTARPAGRRRRANDRQPCRATLDDPALDDALAQLGDPDREVIGLWAWEQLTPAEIAVVLGMHPERDVDPTAPGQATSRGEIVGETKEGDRRRTYLHEHGEEGGR